MCGRVGAFLPPEAAHDQGRRDRQECLSHQELSTRMPAWKLGGLSMSNTPPSRAVRLGLLLSAVALLLPFGRPARAYVEVPYPVGRILAESTNVVLLRVEKVDKQKNLIVYRKVRDIKGTHPGDTVKHNIAQAGFNPREWQNVMAWAAEGKQALFFHNGSAGECCIDGYWYQVYPGEW